MKYNQRDFHGRFKRRWLTPVDFESLFIGFSGLILAFMIGVWFALWRVL